MTPAEHEQLRLLHLWLLKFAPESVRTASQVRRYLAWMTGEREGKE